MKITAVALIAMTMTCSWYGEDFHGRTTASGTQYDMHEYTAASPYLAFGTMLHLSKGDNWVVVEITDRGPYCFNALAAGHLEPHPTRNLDLSKAAFARLAPLASGIIDVKVRPAIPPVVTLPPGIEWEEGFRWR